MKILALHGGAGDRLKQNTSAQEEDEFIQSITAALDAGYAVLTKQGSCIDAVETSIMLLEDAPCFNAGVGAALNSRAEVELDAGLMDGRTLNVGAVAAVQTVEHPIQAARYVMEHTAQVFIVSKAAEELAAKAGFGIVPKEHFVTDTVRRKYEKDIEQREQEKVVLGTVGAVALDDFGNMAAGNSTGGIMHKPVGRVGDAPLCGAGMYARNGIGAIACTGHGEFFVRMVAAHDVVSRMRFLHQDIQKAMQDVLDEMALLGGRGGMIGIAADGTVSMKFSTTSMVRASIDAHGFRTVEVW